MTTPTDAALRFLGLAARSGSVITGTQQVRQGVRRGEVALVIIARDASENSRGKLLPLVGAKGLPHVELVARAELGAAVGRGPLSAVGLTDRGMGRRLSEMLRDAGIVEF